LAGREIVAAEGAARGWGIRVAQTHNGRRARLLGASLLTTALAGMAGPTLAQTAPAGGESQTVSEIVITATRHAESLSKVSQSVVALSEKALDVRGIKGISDISRMTPGVELNPNGFGTQSNIAIRGVSSQVGSATTGIYIDDTPIQTRVVGYSSTNTYPLVFDLDRVEVLRGPQGTLFGAGSEGGTIRFITPQPSLTHYSAYVRAEGSATDGGDASYEGGVAIGGPIVEDKLGFRVSIWDRHDGGYVDRKDLNPELNGTGQVFKNSNWSDTQVGRLALTWSPVANLTITPSLFYQNRNINDIGTFWEGASAPGAGKFVNGQPLAQPDHDRFILPALNVQYELPGVTLISNTSMYQRTDRMIDDYSTLVPAIFAGTNFIPGTPGYSSYALMVNKQTVWTEELRAQSSDKSAKLTWTTGLFISQSTQKTYESIIDPQFGAVTQYAYGGTPLQTLGQALIDNTYSLLANSDGTDKQVALFGEANYRFTDQLKATIGLRVARSSFTGSGYGTGPFIGGTTVQPTSSTTETPVTPKAGLSYQMDDNNLFYASAAEGYRIGGTNAPLSASCLYGPGSLTAQGYSQAPAGFQSDSVWSYELGSKNKLFDRTLEIDASVYHIDWRDIQQLVYVSSCGQQFVDNLGQASSNGFDIQFEAHPLHGLTIEGSLGYTDATYSKTVNKDPTAGNVVTKGDHLDTQPWSGTLGVTYEAAVFGDHHAFIRADYTYHSGSLTTPVTDAANGGYDPTAINAPATSFLSLRSGVRWSGYDVSLFVDNVTNAHPDLTRYSEVIGNPVHRDFTFRPLTVGVTAAYRY
jgi:outer membrane receptor protein involved in Fe transport